MTYKHVSVRTRSLACRIIEFALPVCNVMISILTALLLLSHGFIINSKQFYATWGMADFTAPVQWKHQTLLHPQTGGLLPEGAVQCNRHQLGFPACKGTCLELVKTQAASGHTWFSTVKFQIPSLSTPLFQPTLTFLLLAPPFSELQRSPLSSCNQSFFCVWCHLIIPMFSI